MLHIYKISPITHNQLHQRNRFAISDGQQALTAITLEELAGRVSGLINSNASQAKTGVEHLSYTPLGAMTVFSLYEAYRNSPLMKPEQRKLERILFSEKKY